MDIRKIAIGPDYKGGAMHYIVGQNVLNNQYTIHLIRQDKEDGSTSTMPISVEYNINF